MSQTPGDDWSGYAAERVWPHTFCKGRGGRQLEAVFWVRAQPPDWELILSVNGNLQQSESCRSFVDALHLAEQWQSALFKRGWVSVLKGPLTAEDIRGWDLDWLGTDAEEHVALFTTFGGGYAPKEFLQDPNSHQVAIRELLATAARTKVLFAPDMETPPHPQNTWQLVAERGLFAFESDMEGGPYRLVAAPQKPARMTELPDSVAAVAGAIMFPRLKFAELEEILFS